MINQEIERILDNVHFAHLHLHDHYSLKDGKMSTQEMIDRGKELGLYAIAQTNHGKMYGSYEFYTKCVATEDKHKNPLTPIKPIVGVEAYVETESLNIESINPKGRKKYFHMILLAKNYKGYQELCRSTKHSEKNYHKGKPCLTREDLYEFFGNGNIIALSACVAGEVQQLLIAASKCEKIENSLEYKTAKEITLMYKDLFKGDFYMELQNHGIEEQRDIIKMQVKLAKECGVKCVITSDAHFAKREDKKLHDILICMQFGKTLEEYDNKAYTEHHYMKSKEELFEDFQGYMPNSEIIEALNNTGEIADKCDLVFPKDSHYPKYNKLPKDKTASGFLKEWAYQDMPKVVEGFNILSENRKKIYYDRLDKELSVIDKTGYSDYFLIVADMLDYYNNKIHGYTGPGRGSGVGSLVAYSIGITKADPVVNNLYFDRFLNLERVSPPDFDLDYDNLRKKIFEYTEEEYGKEKVCKIITFGKLVCKSAIRAVARVLGKEEYPLYEVDKICKAIKDNPNVDIKSSLDPTSDSYSVEFENLYKSEERIKNLIDIAQKFEGQIDHTGIHAAACIIGDDEISNYVPLQWDENTGMWCSQFYKDYNESLGLLKMDYLGLNNLSVIKEAARLINKRYVTDLDNMKIINLALNDKDIVKEIYAKGLTKMVFQFESPGMRDTLIRFGPTTFNDIVLLNAVYRPGPIQYIDKIIEGKKHPESIKYDHECLRPILEETYGYPVYQEQIMAIFRTVCGYSLGQADIIRRAMGKKKYDLLANARKDFVNGYVKLGLSEKRANEFFDELMDFASYSFNKSHAVAYCIVSFETAYLKLRYPVEYMTACLSYIPNLDAYPSVLEECKEIGIKVLNPSINKSEELFSIEGNNIRFGLSCIKGVSNSAKSIIENRPYTSYGDFVVKSDSFKAGKGVIENLAYAGAFDEFNITRSTAIQNINLIQGHRKSLKKVAENQIDFFSNGQLSNDDFVQIKDYKEIPYQEKLEKEYEVCYAYISGHPLDQYREFCKQISQKQILEINEKDDGKEYDIIGRIKESDIIYRKKDNAPMGKLVIEDLTGKVNAIAFTKEFDKYKMDLIKGNVRKIRVKIQVNMRETDDGVKNEIQFIIREVSNLEALQKIFIKVKTLKDVEKAEEIVKHHIGGTQIIYYVEEINKVIKSRHLICFDESIKANFGEDNIAI